MYNMSFHFLFFLQPGDKFVMELGLPEKQILPPPASCQPKSTDDSQPSSDDSPSDTQAVPSDDSLSDTQAVPSPKEQETQLHVSQQCLYMCMNIFLWQSVYKNVMNISVCVFVGSSQSR